jgi:hypothetical protein
VTVILSLPRFVVAKPLADGRPAFYFQVPGKYRKLGCALDNQALGRDYAEACGENGNGGRAAALNAHFDEWQDVRRGLPVTGERAPIYGTVRWLLQEYRRSKAYTEKVSPRSRPDYERTMLIVENILTKKGDKIGDRKIKAITPISADKIYGISRSRWRATTASRESGYALPPSMAGDPQVVSWRIQSRRAKSVERRHDAASGER